MKTIQISDALWKRLRVEAAQRGVTMREVVEELGAQWRGRVAARQAQTPPGPPVQSSAAVRELKVEWED